MPSKLQNTPNMVDNSVVLYLDSSLVNFLKIIV